MSRRLTPVLIFCNKTSTRSCCSGIADTVLVSPPISLLCPPQERYCDHELEEMEQTKEELCALQFLPLKVWRTLLLKERVAYKKLKDSWKANDERLSLSTTATRRVVLSQEPQMQRQSRMKPGMLVPLGIWLCTGELLSMRECPT
jgi:hypothetical protein